MKTTLLKFLISFFCVGMSVSISNAQQLIYNNVQNVDMLVANIFGVQCEGVSNVQLIGSPLGVAHFENGQAIGLHSGIALLTGGIYYTDMNPQNFASSQIGGPPDADINQYEVINGTGQTSYDAISLVFDFTPQVSDTIRFSYVFASEEYPEYVNSSFNDRFLFLVSENGGANTNIALVPGTTTIVDVNSVNGQLNQQFYVDNLNGFGSQDFIFDGYTTPFEAKFYAQVGSTYHIKLVLADVGDGIFDSAIFLDEQESYNDISGLLTVNGQMAEGTLDIFNFVEDTLLALPVQTIQVTNGEYTADSLNTGIYHVRFTPDPILFPNAMPLYFNTGNTWATAEAVGLPCFLDNANIDADTSIVYNTGSSIFGGIIIDTSFMKSPSIPFENARVLLLNEVTNKVVGFTYSDVDGKYSFNHVQPGDYYILIDAPYIPQSDAHHILVTSNANIYGADYDVLTDGIHPSGNPFANVGLDENKKVEFALYPNPANESFQLVFNQKTEGKIAIYSVDGTLVKQLEINGMKTTVSTKELGNGMYFVQAGNSQVKRLLIQH